MSSVEATRNPLQHIEGSKNPTGGAVLKALPVSKYDEALLEADMPPPTTCCGHFVRPCINCCCGKFPLPAKGWIMYDFADSVFTIASR